MNGSRMAMGLFWVLLLTGAEVAQANDANQDVVESLKGAQPIDQFKRSSMQAVDLLAQTPTPKLAPTQDSGGQQPEDEEELTVTGTRERDSGYRVPNSSTATGTDTPILETPFSVQVIPKDVIRDQQITRIEDVLRNVSSVNISGTDGGRAANFSVRGFGGSFGARTPMLKDGYRQYGSFQSIPEVANLEQVEVLKGPSSILYGAIEPGGIINLVSKQPLSERLRELELQVGSSGLLRTYVDLTGPLTPEKNLLYRLGILYKNENNPRGFETLTNRVSVAPSLTWKISDRTKLNFSLEYTYNKGPADFGITKFGTGVASIPLNRTINNPDDSIATKNLSVGYSLEHEFNDNWKIRNGFRYLRYEFDYSVLALPFVIDGASVTRYYADQDSISNSYSFNTSVVGKFSTGSIKHTLTSGIDLNRSTQSLLTLFDIANPSTIDIFAPDYNFVRKPLRSSLPLFGDTTDNSTRLGAYLQDQVYLRDNLILVAGLRYDTITQTSTTVETAFSNKSESTQVSSAVTPRIGVIYRPIKEMSLFASYSQSFNPSSGTTVSGDLLKPERGQGFDLGVKTELLNQKLLATLTYFNITKNNVGVVDPSFPLFSTAVGQQKSRGVELDVAGELAPGWKVIGSYAYTDAKVSEDTTLENVGKQFSSVPKHSASLWTTYEIQKGSLKGLGFGAGVNYVGDRFGDLANTFKLGDYLTGNASIFYNRDNYRFALNFKNIANVQYIESSTGSEGGVEPGAPFTAIASLTVKF